MTAKDYFRSLALHDLGIEIDPLVIHFDQYIKERLSDLIKYESNVDPHGIYYGKSSNELILVYYPVLNMISFYYWNFSKKLANKFKLDEMKKIVAYYISNILLIEDFYIHQHIQENIIKMNSDDITFTVSKF